MRESGAEGLNEGFEFHSLLAHNLSIIFKIELIFKVFEIKFDHFYIKKNYNHTQ